MGLAPLAATVTITELDGKRLSHVIDPQTGRPIEHNLVSVTVIAPTALEADAYWLDGTRAGEAKRRLFAGKGWRFMITKEKAIALKPGCHHSLKASLSAKKLKRKIVGSCVMVTPGSLKAIFSQGLIMKKSHMLN